MEIGHRLFEIERRRAVTRAKRVLALVGHRGALAKALPTEGLAWRDTALTQGRRRGPVMT